MGYAETRCDICKVSFNIGRIRKPSEPPEAAWGITGDFLDDFVAQRSDFSEDSDDDLPSDRPHETEIGQGPEDQGCLVVRRDGYCEGSCPTQQSDSTVKYLAPNDLLDTVEKDPDFTVALSTEPNESDSESESEEEDCCDGASHSLEDQEDALKDLDKGDPVEDSDVESQSEREYQNFLQTFSYEGQQLFSIHRTDEVYIPLKTWKVSAQRENPGIACDHCDRRYRWEHIAGPRCRCSSGYCDGGYNGNFITAEEMRGCRTAQFLVRNDYNSDAEDGIGGQVHSDEGDGGSEDFNNEDDGKDENPTGEDEDGGEVSRGQGNPHGEGCTCNEISKDCNGENEGEYEYDDDSGCEGVWETSAFEDAMPSLDVGRPCGDIEATNMILDEEDAEKCAIAFHPTCLEIYKRVCLRRKGHIDIEGLANWWYLDTLGCDTERGPQLPSDAAVRRGADQWWQCVIGDEYLVANPLFIPDLSKLLQSVTKPTREGVVEHAGAPSYGSVISSAPHSVQDIFSRLPTELMVLVLRHLDSTDLGTLRRVSRSFRNLPQRLLKDWVLLEYPWLWEGWSSRSYPYLTAMSEPHAGHTFRPSWFHPDVRHWNHETYNRIKGILQESSDDSGALAALEKTGCVDCHRRKTHGERELEVPEIEPVMIAADQTDWGALAVAVDKAMRENRLKGLRNRARIWKICDHICDRIDFYRAEGWMRKGEIVDVKRLYRQREERWHNRA